MDEKVCLLYVNTSTIDIFPPKMALQKEKKKGFTNGEKKKGPQRRIMKFVVCKWYARQVFQCRFCRIHTLHYQRKARLLRFQMVGYCYLARYFLSHCLIGVYPPFHLPLPPLLAQVNNNMSTSKHARMSSIAEMPTIDLNQQNGDKISFNVFAVIVGFRAIL